MPIKKLAFISVVIDNKTGMDGCITSDTEISTRIHTYIYDLFALSLIFQILLCWEEEVKEVGGRTSDMDG